MGLGLSGLVYPNSITTGSCGMSFTILTLYGSQLIQSYKQQDYGKALIGLYFIIFLVNIFIILETKSTNIAIVGGGLINGLCFSFLFNFQFLNPKLNKIKYIAVLFTFSTEFLLIGLLMNKEID